MNNDNGLGLWVLGESFFISLISYVVFITVWDVLPEAAMFLGVLMVNVVFTRLNHLQRRVDELERKISESNKINGTKVSRSE